MGFRFVVWLSLAICCWGQPHSDWYVQALQGVMDWDARDMAKREEALRRDPFDMQARLQLMAYAMRADQEGRSVSAAKRLPHVLWLIEHAPESEILRSYLARLSRDELGEANLAKLVRLWRNVKIDSGNVAWNATMFFWGSENNESWKYLEATVRLSPENATAIRTFAIACAEWIQKGGEKRAAAEKALAESSNPWLLSNTAHQMYMRGIDGADGYFLRAKMMEPSIRAEQVFPAPVAVQPAKQIRMGEVKRLASREFIELPPGLAELLTRRGCTIPQPYGEKSKRNVIRGEFFEQGEKGWAVLCSVNGKSSVLVFRNDADRQPAVLASVEDRGYMQGMGGDTYEYSRAISAVGRDFITRHYRAFGGPRPPEIDHEGIDDAFLGKASSVWYWHAGKWLRLQGAD